MTSGVGNPDWQRRYNISAVALYTGSFSDAGTTATGTLDTNGYTYLLVSTNSNLSAATNLITITWYQDAARTIFLGTTDYVPVPSTFTCQRVPVLTRYCTLTTTYISGTTGQQIVWNIYGSTSTDDNLLSTETSRPLVYFNGNVNSGAVQTSPLTGMYGGKVTLSMGSLTNNKWDANLQYYDRNALTWNSFLLIFGSDKGIFWSQEVRLPYSPVRVNMANDDTVTRQLIFSVIAE